MMRFILSAVVLACVCGSVDAARRGRQQVTYAAPMYYVSANDGAVPASGDALDEVNAARARRGLRPYLRDEGLAQAATAASSYRAAHRISGHTSNDFAFLPPGSSAGAAGCGSLDASWGWASCCTYENWTYAGAAVVVGADGRRFMHLFVR